MKLVFLDLDGVLLNRKSYRQHSGLCAPADPECVQCLNHILQSTGALVVVTSIWRYEGLMFLRESFKQWGVKDRVLIDCTADCRSWAKKPTRGVEIKWWIDSRADHLNIQSFVILDDDSDMGPLSEFLVRTSTEQGLTMAEAEFGGRDGYGGRYGALTRAEIEGVISEINAALHWRREAGKEASA